MRNRLFKSPVAWAMLAAIVSLLHGSLVAAQTDRAAVAFEGSPTALLESKLAESLGLKDLLNQGSRGEMTPFLEAKSVKGVVRFPDSFDEVANATPRNSPLDFYVRFEFAEKGVVQPMVDQLKTRSEVTEFDDYTELRPDRDTNVYLAVGDRWMVFATDHFEVDKDSLDRLSTGLKNWKKNKDADFQAALDMAAARKFLKEAGAMLQQVNPAASMGTQVISQTDFLTLTVSPDEQKMAVLTSESSDKENAEKFLTTLTGLLSAGKMVLEKAPANEKSADMALQMLEAMVPGREGRTVTLVMERPENFDKLLKEMFDNARGQAQQAQKMNDIKQVALSMHNYHDVYNRFPFLPGENDSKQLSWRVRVLPFIEQAPLLEMFDMNEPWDGPTNKKLVELQPPTFGSDNESLVCWVESQATSFRDITDGTSNTIALILVPKQMNWSEPKDLTPEQAVKVLKEVGADGSLLVGYYDGSVRRISGSMDPEEFMKLLTINGGEVVR